MNRITVKRGGGTNFYRYGAYADGYRVTPRMVPTQGAAVDAALRALGATVLNPWDWDRHLICLTDMKGK